MCIYFLQIHRHHFMGNQVVKVFAAKDDEVSVAWCNRSCYTLITVNNLFLDSNYTYRFRLFPRHLKSTHFCLLHLRPIYRHWVFYCVCVQHAAVALSALIQALDSLKMVAIVRYAYDRRSNPQVGAAFPCIKDSYEVCGSESYWNMPHAMCVTLESPSFLPLLSSAWCMCSYHTWKTSVSLLSLHWRTTRNLLHQVWNWAFTQPC